MIILLVFLMPRIEKNLSIKRTLVYSLMAMRMLIKRMTVIS